MPPGFSSNLMSEIYTAELCSAGQPGAAALRGYSAGQPRAAVPR